MDVSVLRSFYQDLAKVTLPDGLAEMIKSGVGRSGARAANGGSLHRALDDAKNCAEALRECVAYARNRANNGTTVISYGQIGGITGGSIG